MSSLSVKAKLIISFVAISVGTLIVAVLSATMAGSVITKFKNVSDNNVPNLVQMIQMGRTMTRLNVPANKAYMSSLPQADYKDLLVKTQQIIDDFEVSAKIYEANKFAEGEEEVWNTFKRDHWTPYKTQTLAMIGTLAESTTPEAHAKADAMFLELEKLGKSRNEVFDRLVKFQNDESAMTAKVGVEMFDHLKTMNFAIAGVAILISILVGYFLSAYFAKELGRISTDITGGATQVSDAAEQISQSAQSLSGAATEAAASLEESVASVEEISSMVKMNSDRSQQGRMLSITSVETASRAEVSGKELISAIESLDQSSKKIEDIVNIIDDIAFQTNLLALNASVEAARAGEQGKGFAVVAEAVRSLAQRSSVSAKDIATLIKDSSEKTRVGVQLAEANRKALAEVIDGVKKVAAITEEVSAANSEIANGIGQITTAMNQLDQVTQQNAAVAEEAAATSEELSAQSMTLKQSGNVLSIFLKGA